MRTTVALDDDVYWAIRERASREKRSAGSVLSELARSALAGGPAGGSATDAAERNGLPILPSRGTTVVTRELVERLLDDEIPEA